MSRRTKKIGTTKIGTTAKRDKANEQRRTNTARALYFINSAIWLAYVVYVYYDMAVLNNNKSSADLATLFVFINAVALFGGGMLLGRLRAGPYIFALVVAFLNGAVSLVNLANFFFLTSFALDVAILWFLYHLRRRYLSIL